MILTELKSYLIEHRRVPLMDLAYHFQTTPEAIKDMLTHFLRKGKVRHLAGNRCEKNCCCQSDPTNLEIYEWVE